MKKLPDGMYQRRSSVIHRLDPTVKIVLLAVLIAAVIAANTLAGYGIVIAFAMAAAMLSHIGIHAALGSVKRLLWFFVVIFIMNLCFFKSENAWVRFWIFSPSYDGMMQGIKVVVRVVVILVFCNILNTTTPPVAVTNAIENLLSPLRFIRVPTRQIALILSVSIQFIPILFEEADNIKKAQLARGARFDSRRLTDKAAAVLPMVVPIFVCAFRRADELSLAMESRGYRIDAKCKSKRSFHIGFTEVMALALCIALCAVQIVLRTAA